jgi:hypothetical protein
VTERSQAELAAQKALLPQASLMLKARQTSVPHAEERGLLDAEMKMIGAPSFALQ